jgi:hypothetical protein
VIEEYQAVCAENVPKYKAGPAFMKEGKLYTMHTSDGTPGKLLYLVSPTQRS